MGVVCNRGATLPTERDKHLISTTINENIFMNFKIISILLFMLEKIFSALCQKFLLSAKSVLIIQN